MSKKSVQKIMELRLTLNKEFSEHFGGEISSVRAGGGAEVSFGAAH